VGVREGSPRQRALSTHLEHRVSAIFNVVLAFLLLVLTPEQRSLRARIAANTRWSRENPAENAARGQKGLLAKFAREVDPDGVLPEAERLRRAEKARQVHMQQLAFRSSKARSRKASA